jgi:hypothetical protein
MPVRILYFSVHAILEYDEIRLFQSLGYTVFPLGSYFGGKRTQDFRPEIEFGREYYMLLDEFRRLGGIYSPHNACLENYIPEEFVDMFDACIIMHEPSVIAHYWSALSRRPVVWRTIGVDIEGADEKLRPFRDRGLKIVRYCPTESLGTKYLGHDAVIRFAKRRSDFLERRPDETFALTFSNDFAQRYPQEFALFAEATDGKRAFIGGMGNEACPDQLGLVSYERQLSLLSMATCYLYFSGTFIPYTLNFMEAWLAGAPLVALDCRAFYPEERCKFAEIPQLITNGEDGFLVKSVAEARDVLNALFDDEGLAHRIGEAGAAKAMSLFDEEVNGRAWKAFLEGL